MFQHEEPIKLDLISGMERYVLRKEIRLATKEDYGCDITLVDNTRLKVSNNIVQLLKELNSK